MANTTYLDLTGLQKYDGKVVERQTNAIAEALKSAKDYTDELKNGQVKTNTDTITTLNGEDTVDGSVKAQIKAAKTELEGKITSSTYDDTTLKGRVSTVEGAVETLNGDAQTVGSVAKQVADAVAKIIANAPEAYDTLQEIATWISTHENSAATMNQSIQTNKTDIANLVKLVGTLPEGDASKTIVEYIDSKVSGVDFSTAIATAKQEAIDAAKTYSDGLAKNYATADQGKKADTALQEADVATLRTDVAANKASLGVGGATTVAIADAKKAGTDAQASVTALEKRVVELEGDTFTAITNEQIDALFATV